MPAWASDWLRILTFLSLIALIWYSRRWTAPKQDAELRAVEDDVEEDVSRAAHAVRAAQRAPGEEHDGEHGERERGDASDWVTSHEQMGRNRP